MKPIDGQTLSLIGFAASEWAKERVNGSRHRTHYRRLIVAGLTLHENGHLYAAAPRMRRALDLIARHAGIVERIENTG